MSSKKDTELEKATKKPAVKATKSDASSSKKAPSAKAATTPKKSVASSKISDLKDLKKDVLMPKTSIQKDVKESSSDAKTEASKDQDFAKLVVHPKKTAKSSKNGNESYATGKRKNSIARVWLRQGDGKFVVNTKSLDSYFTRETHKVAILKPFVLTKTFGQYNILCTVRGGGSSGQAGALAHGIAKALNIMVPELHSALRKAGLLTRDPRIVERKKYGKHKARKSTQFSKR